MLTKRHGFLLALTACLLAVSMPALLSGSSITITYLQQASDRYQHTVDVYTDADAAGNHFPARGEFDNLQANRVAAMDEISTGAPCLGVTCITATFDPRRAVWGGWYFMNGVLGPTARQPVPNWGDQPNAGYDLTGATALQFWARGAFGGEVVHFFAFGVGNTEPPYQRYPDSSAKVELPQGPVVLSTAWTQYRIPLTGRDLHYIVGGFGWIANAVEGNRLQPPITFYLDNIQYLKDRSNDPRLLVSYETIKSTDPFDVVLRNAAYVYDNAVSLIALIASGDLARARTTADALVYAQGHDRFFTDGRIRNAYQGSDISLPPGWLPNNLASTVRMPGWYDANHATWFEDETQVSTNTGNVAWAGLGLLNMWEVTKDPKYLTAAEALGNWALSNAGEKRDGAAGVLGGFTGGYDGWENGAVSGSAANCASGVLVNGQCKRLYKSTEHNIDLYSMLSRLYLADGAPKWATAAQQAKHFFLSMWDSQEGKFWTGTSEDGVTIFRDVIPVDIQAWAIQTLGTEAQPFLQSLTYVETHHKTSLGYGFKQNGGNACGDNTWFEGTSQVAVAYLLSGNKAKWQSVLDGVHSVQTRDGGIPATDGACLNTGFTLNDGSPWRYFPRVHVGATGWLALAENGINPYRAELYSPALSASGVAFGDQSVGEQGSARPVTFSNPGTGPLSIRGLALAGPNASDFQQSNNCGTSLPSRATCTVTLSFTPEAIGARSATLTITESSDPAMAPAVLSVGLSGNGLPSLSSFVLTLSSVPQVGGTITSTPAPTNGTYQAGARVCLTAAPAAGWSFARWLGDSLDANGCLIMTANRSVTGNFAGGPVIQLKSIPPYGAVNRTIAGTVIGVTASNYQIAALVFLSGQGWFSKPYCTSTTTALSSDGSFSIQLTTGGVDQFATRIALLVVPSSLVVNCYTAVSGIPMELLRQAAAQIIINRPNPNEREIGFSGQKWAVKASTVPIGPGNCVFSDSPDNVFVDTEGNLHLRIVNRNGNWTCAEIYSRAAVGYGVYQWTIDSAPSLDPSAVFGSFTWADAELNPRELDVEFGFNKPGDPTNAQFVLQPFARPGNLQRVTIPTTSPITLKMTWLPDTLLFQAFVGVDDRGNKIQEWRYTGESPPADSQYENFRFNLWLNGAPPSSGRPQEVIVNRYQYQAFEADPSTPTLNGLLSAASFLPGAAPGMDFALFGRNFSSVPTAASPPLPLSLGGITVVVNGIPAPLFYVNSNQINGQVPYIVPLGPSLLSVSANGRTSQMLPFTNAPTAPGIFVGPSQNCLVQNQDQTLNSPNNPAGAGSTITAYLAGIGQVDNPVQSGSIAPPSPLSRALLASTAAIDGRDAGLEFLGLVAGLVGVGQANIHLPENVSGGPRPLVVTIGGIPSNSCSLSIAGGSPGMLPTIATSSLSSGSVGTAYSQTLSAGGGTPPYNNWTVSAGALPPGLALNASSGIISGTPSTAGGSPFSFSVTVKDAASNTSVAKVLSIAILAGPTIATLSLPNGSVSAAYSQMLSASGGTPPYSNWTVSAGTLPPGLALNASSGAISGTPSSATGSPFAFSVSVGDNAGNTSSVQKLSIAITPTLGPTIGSVLPTFGTTTGGTAVSIFGSNFASGATVRFGNNNANISQIFSGQIQATTPPGTGTVTVTVVNLDGQSGALANGYTYRTIPTLSSIQPIEGSRNGGTSITLTGTGFTAGATVTLGGVAATQVNVVNFTTITAVTGFINGGGSFDVTLTNPDGQSATLPKAFTYTQPPPAGPTISSVSPTFGTTSGGTAVSIFGSNFVSGATVRFGNNNATVSQIFSGQIQATAPPGTGTVTVVVVNPDGQSASLPNAYAYRIIPTLSSIQPTEGSRNGGTSVTLTGTGFAAGATVTLGRVAATQVTVVNSSTVTGVTGSINGGGTFDVTLTNPDGQSATLPKAFNYTQPPPPAPTISSVSPTLGTTAGGTAVSIFGSNFVSGATVRFGNSNATIAQLFSGQIQVTSPPGSGNVSITVVNPDGQSASLPNAYTYRIIPTLSSIQPMQGSRNGGTSITLIGTGFAAGATVSIGGVAATQVAVVNPSSITALTGPINGGGTFDVTLTNPDGQSATLPKAFTYTQPSPPAPTISSVSPTLGTTTGGMAVSIFGSNFVSGATVRFGNSNATISQLFSGQIQATTPPGTGTVSITVVNPDGQSGVLSNAFTYQSPTTSNPTIQATTQACTVRGTVTGVNPPPAFSVVVYAYTNQYYVQACDIDPPATISPNGAWGPVDSHSGAISAILVRQGYVPASILQSLPRPDGVNVFAVSSVAGTLAGCDVARCPAR